MAGITGLVLAATAAPVGAQVPTLGVNPSGNQVPGMGSFKSGNCIAYYSAQVIHNGVLVRFQDRQAEIKLLQATCNLASETP